MEIRTSPLVGMAKEAARPTRWWAAWIVGVVIMIGGSLVGDLVGVVVLGDPKRADTRFQYVEFFIFGVSLLLLFFWVRFKERRPFTSVGFRGPEPLRRLALGFVIGAAMMTIAVAIPWGLGQYGTGMSQHTTTGAGALVLLLPLLALFVFQASTEEAVTRGYMLQVGGSQIAAWPAIIGTSIVFAVAHLDFHPLPLLNIAIYAVFASVVALAEGNLWLICGIHAGWNYFQGNVFGLPVSGNTEATSLFAFGPAPGSQTLATGGDFGVEASIVGTGVLIVALLVALAYHRRRAAERSASSAGPSAVTDDTGGDGHDSH